MNRKCAKPGRDKGRSLGELKPLGVKEALVGGVVPERARPMVPDQVRL